MSRPAAADELERQLREEEERMRAVQEEIARLRRELENTAASHGPSPGMPLTSPWTFPIFSLLYLPIVFYLFDIARTPLIVASATPPGRALGPNVTPSPRSESSPRPNGSAPVPSTQSGVRPTLVNTTGVGRPSADMSSLANSGSLARRDTPPTVTRPVAVSAGAAPTFQRQGSFGRTVARPPPPPGVSPTMSASTPPLPASPFAPGTPPSATRALSLCLC